MIEKELVLVAWKDAHACYEQWSDPEDLDQADYMCYSAGFMLKDVKPGWVVLVLNTGEDNRVGDGISIPDAMVVEIVPLGPATPSSIPLFDAAVKSESAHLEDQNVSEPEEALAR